MRSISIVLMLASTPALADTLPVGAGQAYTTIQDAVDAAEDGDVIAIDPGTYDELVRIDGVEGLTLSALGAVVLTGSDDSVLRIADAEVSIIGLDVQADGGRAIRIEASTVALTGVTVSGNVTSNQAYNGAGIAIFDSSNVTIDDGTFFLNRTTPSFIPGVSNGNGGHVYSVDSTLEVSASSFETGQAERGAGIYAAGSGTLTVLTSTFQDLQSDENGGAVYVGGGVSATITNSTFAGNSAALGGAVRWQGDDRTPSLSLIDNTFVGNDTSDYGGAVAVNTGGSLQLETNTFTHNASTNGGAVSLFNVAGIDVHGNVFCGNSGAGQGGAFRVRGSGGSGSGWTNNVFIDQSAGSEGGGALWLSENQPLSVVNNHFLASDAVNGGAVRLIDSEVLFVNNLIGWSGQGSGLAIDAASQLTNHHNAWFTNAPDHISGASLGTGAVTDDPLLLSFLDDSVCGNDDPRPGSLSPLIDGGDPALSDPDGTFSDIGAFGGPNAPEALFADGDGDGFIALSDCNDADPFVHPDAEEWCNGKDDDCDGVTDGGAAMGAGTFFRDGDGDGVGDRDQSIRSCDAIVDGYVSSDADCDDTNDEINPDAIEVCDGADNDCNGQADGTDAADQLTFYEDADVDGYGTLDGSTALGCSPPDGFATGTGDCDDTNREVSPGADELCDGIDNNCDDEIDTDDALDALPWYTDLDGDGWGGTTAPPKMACRKPEGFVRSDTDCNDGDATVHPGAVESCDDPADLNCDGSWGPDDLDADGIPACEDCDDTDPLAFPGAEETWYDGVIHDCTSASDFDADRDGYDAATYGGLDCDDADAFVNPSMRERFGDDIDQDCDGDIGDDPHHGEGLAAGCSGCAGTGTPSAAWLALAPLLMLRRRRR